MFSIHREKKAHPLDGVIDDLITAMRGQDEQTEMYGEYVKQLKTLMELRSADRRDRPPVSSGQALAVAANIIGIVAILGYERTNVITTKAFGLISKINTNP